MAVLEFTCNWHEIIFLHYAVNAEELSHRVAFELDCFENRAIVSFIAFRMTGFRPARGGALARWMLLPVSTYSLLNLRTYVRCSDERAICFLREWVSSSFATRCAPWTFGLPYHRAHIEHRRLESDPATHYGCVTHPRTGRTIEFKGREMGSVEELSPAAAGTLEHFCLEQYVACTGTDRRKRQFRIAHEPWRFIPLDIESQTLELAEGAFPFMKSAQYLSAQYAPILRNIRIHWPKRLIPDRTNDQ